MFYMLQKNDPNIQSLKKQVMHLIQELQSSESKFGEITKAIDSYKERLALLW